MFDVKILSALKYSVSSTKKIEYAVSLICNGHDIEAIRVLDTIGARANPQYGHEIISATVFYYKGMAEFNLGNEESALFYLSLVEGIPSWRVLYGRSTLLEIKEEARKLKFRI